MSHYWYAVLYNLDDPQSYMDSFFDAGDIDSYIGVPTANYFVGYLHTPQEMTQEQMNILFDITRPSFMDPLFEEPTEWIEVSREYDTVIERS